MSDQYTPTTVEVRFAYTDRRDFDSQIGLGEGPGDEEAGAEFDRWLASVKAEAWEQGFEDAHAAHHRENVRLNRRSPAIAIINPYREQETP